jgi:hypothetical protein
VRISQLRTAALEALQKGLPALRRSAQLTDRARQALQELCAAEKNAPVQAKAAALLAKL